MFAPFEPRHLRFGSHHMCMHDTSAKAQRQSIEDIVSEHLKKDPVKEAAI